MKKTGLLLLLAGLLAGGISAQTPANQQAILTQENRQPARTTFMSYDNGENAVTLDYTRSPFYVPLKKWNFRLASGPDDLARFYVPTYSGAQTEIDVPGYFAQTSKEGLAGLKPPALPSANATGQYRTQFEVPVFWLDRDIFFRAEGVKGGLTLYVNGIRVGYSDESGTPAEFNISPYVTDGINTLGMEISQWSAGSWLDNGTLNGAGIEGDVYLYSQYRIHIHDFAVEATLDSLNKNGVFNLAVEVVNNFNKADSIVVYYDLRDEAGKPVRYNTRETVVPGQGGRDTVYFTGKIPNVKKWTPETPNQYQLVVRIRYQGRFTEYIPFMVGFRKLEMDEGVYTLNGNPIEFKGKEYLHAGITPDDKTIRAELARIKQEKYNLVRCPYHPRKSRVYELCGELGLWVCDEVNLDTSLTGEDRSAGGTLSNNPAWIDAYLARMENTWRFSRNYSNVVAYSVGKGPGVGYNIYRSYLKLKQLEPLRPVIYTPAGDIWCTDPKTWKGDF